LITKTNKIKQKAAIEPL